MTLEDAEKQFREADPDRDKITDGETLEALRRNEDGDAELFIVQNKDRLRYDHQAGRWYIFDGHHWSLDRLDEATARVCGVVDVYLKEAGRQASLRRKAAQIPDRQAEKKHAARETELFRRVRDLHTAHRKRNVLSLARTGRNGLGLTGEEWDQDPMLLGVANGVVDLRTGDHRPGQPGDYIKTFAPTAWLGLEEPASAWVKALSEIFSGDEEMTAYIQRLLGYALTGTVREHILLVAWGCGRNGKGTMFETLHFVLGDMLTGPIEAEMLLSQRYSKASGGPSSDIMALRGKRIVWGSETGQGRSLDVGKTKWLTGGDTLTGRQPYAVDPISFSPTHTLFLLTNHRPGADGNNYALWKRMHLIEFSMSFVQEPEKAFERQVDPDLPAMLRAEASGILAWLVRGALEYQRTGLGTPEKVKAWTAEYQKDEDLLGHFIDECCILERTAKTSGGDLYKAYRTWCESTGHRPLSGVRFGKDMKERFNCEDGRIKYYTGIGLLDRSSN